MTDSVRLHPSMAHVPRAFTAELASFTIADPPVFPMDYELGGVSIRLHLDGRAEFDADALRAALAGLKRSDMGGLLDAPLVMIAWMLLSRGETPDVRP